jgi:hypothetical protein
VYLALVVLGDVQTLSPGDIVVDVVLQLVVLWQTPQIGVLHLNKVISLKYIHVENNNVRKLFLSSTLLFHSP